MTIDRWGPRLAIGLMGVSVAMGITGLLLKQELVRADLGGVPFFAFGLVGMFVAMRQPGNPVGWLFMVVGIMPVVGFFSSAYAARAIQVDPGSLPGGEVATWISAWAWIPGVATLLTFGLLLYPAGHLPSPRWRTVSYGAAVAMAGAVTGIALMPGKMEPFEEGGPRLVNPFGIEGAGGILEPLAGLSLSALVFFGALSVASLAFRFRQTSPQQRQQIKWFMYPAALLVVVVLLESQLEMLMGAEISELFFTFAILLLPIGTGIGILRYRLFDIDVVINRTLVYLSLTAILIGTYLGIVVVVQGILTGVTADSDIAVAASTLAVAAMFRPLRSRIQMFIDHRFYRRKYDATATLERFSSRLRDQVDLDSLRTQVLTVVGETIQPAHASLWLRSRGTP